MATNPTDSRLCFLESRRLQAPLIEPFDVWTVGGKRIGTFDGVVIDPSERRARYLVVDRGRLLPDRCLIPLPAHVDLVHHALEVEECDPVECEKFNPAHFRRLTSANASSIMGAADGASI